MFALLLLLACTDTGSTTDTGTPVGGCQGDPEIAILSPTTGAVVAFGDEVTLTAEGTSSADEALAWLWAIDGDVVLVGQNGVWTADIAGEVVLVLQAEDRCGISQADVRINVTAAPDDTGTDDTGTM